VLKRVLSTTKPDGETCFEEEDIPLSAAGNAHAKSEKFEAKHISFRWTPGHFDMDFHLAPRRRLVLLLEGGLEVETSDGEIRVFHPGDIWEIRDTWGKGHCSRAYQGRPFRTAFVALDDDITLDRRAPLTETPDRAQAFWKFDGEREDGAEPHRVALPYTLGGVEGWVTDEYPAASFHFLASERGGQLNYVPGSRPSTECVLSGRFSETMDGTTHYTVASGEIIFRREAWRRERHRQTTVGPNGLFLSIIADADISR
jgi:uncharacterized cupin superfamily protein